MSENLNEEVGFAVIDTINQVLLRWGSCTRGFLPLQKAADHELVVERDLTLPMPRPIIYDPASGTVEFL